jgi:uncharacterized membrane-anchored protein YitT (DUF2179 family)
MPLIHTVKSKALDVAKDFAAYIVGSALLAISIDMFTAPNHIAPGGLSGICTMINYLTKLPIGVMTLLLNIPVFIWAFVEIDFSSVVKSFVAMIISSVAIDVFSWFVVPYNGSVMLACIFGGVLQGIALALIFMRSATTGGTDLIAQLLGRHVRFLPIGKLMLCVDGLVVIASAVVYHSIENAMYAIIAIFVCSKLIDVILYGTDIGTGKVLFIISSKSHEIADEILSDVDRGVTILDSRGAYSGKEGEVLLCAVRRFEVAQVKDIVHTIDHNAFLIVGEAGEITGEGFRPAKVDPRRAKRLKAKLKRRKEHEKEE